MPPLPTGHREGDQSGLRNKQLCPSPGGETPGGGVQPQPRVAALMLKGRSQGRRLSWRCYFSPPPLSTAHTCTHTRTHTHTICVPMLTHTRSQLVKDPCVSPHCLHKGIRMARLWLRGNTRVSPKDERERKGNPEDQRGAGCRALEHSTDLVPGRPPRWGRNSEGKLARHAVLGTRMPGASRATVQSKRPGWPGGDAGSCHHDGCGHSSGRRAARCSASRQVQERKTLVPV